MTIEVDDSAARTPLATVPIDQVAILVECLWSHFDGALVRDFVPLLVQKQAREELLDHLARTTGRRSGAP